MRNAEIHSVDKNKTDLTSQVNINHGLLFGAATMHRLILLSAIILSPGCKLKDTNDSSTSLTAATPESLTEIRGLYTKEAITADDASIQNHNSTIVELGSGHLMSCWTASNKDAAQHAKVNCSEKIAGGAWTPPRTVVESSGTSSPSIHQSSTTPVLFKDQEGIIWLFYESEEKTIRTTGFKVSKDNGQTFSAGEKLAGNIANLRSKPLLLSSGRFMIPAYKDEPKPSAYVVMLTPDQGVIKDSRIIIIPGSSHKDPSLTIKEDIQGVNKVFAYLTDETTKHVALSEYDFIAGSFSATRQSNVLISQSAIDAVTIDDNQILMTFNDTTLVHSPLSLGVSQDGHTFRKIWDFETDNGDFSNPSFIRDQNGNFHLTYTLNKKAIRYITFDTIWLSSKLGFEKK